MPLPTKELHGRQDSRIAERLENAERQRKVAGVRLEDAERQCRYWRDMQAKRAQQEQQAPQEAEDDPVDKV